MLMIIRMMLQSKRLFWGVLCRWEMRRRDISMICVWLMSVKVQEETGVQLKYLNLWNEEKVRRLYDER